MASAPPPWIIAHRGASGLRPEHTLEAYRLGIEQGADFVEPDLVMTRDGVLIARHENEISGTTDVGDRADFAHRRATKAVDGRELTGWFTEDFDLAELRTLRARERLPELRPTSAAHDGVYGLVTLDEIVALVRDESRASGRTIGIVAELKHAAYFAGIGLPIEEALLSVLFGNGYNRSDHPCFIECFEPGILQRLRAETDIRLVQLVAETGSPPDGSSTPYAQMTTPQGLSEVARYADAIGPAKALIIPRGSDGASLPPTSLVADAHAAGLLVFPWTFRSENFFLPPELRHGDDPRVQGDAAAEYRQFYELGVDAVFSDFPEEAVRARELPSLRGA